MRTNFCMYCISMELCLQPLHPVLSTFSKKSPVEPQRAVRCSPCDVLPIAPQHRAHAIERELVLTNRTPVPVNGFAAALRARFCFSPL